MPSNAIKVILAITALALGAGAAPAFVAASGDDGHGGHGGNSGHGGGHGGDDDHSTTDDDDSTTTNDDSTTTSSTTTATSTTAASGSKAAARVLIGTVTDDARISLRRKGGGATGVLAPGKYTIRFSDTSSDHNFHLKGPGVDRRTTVDGRSAPTLSLTLRRGGTYSFVCDPHADFMKSSVRVRS